MCVSSKYNCDDHSTQPSDIDNLSNAELLELSKNAPKVHPDAAVVKLTSGTVAKPSQDMDEDAYDAYAPQTATSASHDQQSQEDAWRNSTYSYSGPHAI